MEINKIYNEDCLEGMKRIADGSVDMILCDLPYGVVQCKWDTVIPFEPLWEQYERVVKSNGAIVLTASQPFTSALVMSNPKMFKYCWVWDKKFSGNFTLAKYQPMKIHEDICVFSKKTATYIPQMTQRSKPIMNGGNKCASESARFSRDSRKEGFQKTYTEKYPESILKYSSRAEKRGLHPTQKPVALFEYLINTYTNPGELVLDNCIGSGTTAVASINTRRNFIGFELDQHYYQIANTRINQVLSRDTGR